MKRTSIGFFATLLVLLLMAAQSAEAQHSYAREYDRSQPFSVMGKITKAEYVGIHTWLYISVPNDNSLAEPWVLEILSTRSQLQKSGWGTDTLKAGDEVSVKGWKARTPPPTGSKGLAAQVIFGGKNLMPEDLLR